VPVIEVTTATVWADPRSTTASPRPPSRIDQLAAETAKDAKIAFLMLPGVGTKEDIKEAQDNALDMPDRHALHRADVSIQHFGLARELGLETVGF